MGASILFVCLGNICRSPLAEGAMRAVAERVGLEVTVDSAGTGSWHRGEQPDARAIAAAARDGVDISGLLARQVKPEDFRCFDHIFALDGQNMRDLVAIRPADATAQLALLLDLVSGREGQSVADPWYGNEAGFDVTWDEVSTAAEALVARLMRCEKGGVHRGEV